MRPSPTAQQGWPSWGRRAVPRHWEIDSASHERSLQQLGGPPPPGSRDRPPGGVRVRLVDHAGVGRAGGNEHSGQILVSSAVKDLFAGSSLAFEDRGTHQLKGVSEAWRLYALRRRETSPRKTSRRC
jgi:hypothetical protein